MKVGITLDYRSKGLKLAKQGLKDLGKSALGASLSIGGVTLAIQRMVRSAAEDQRAFANLGQTMRNVGFVGAEHEAKRLFDQLELQHGIVTDDLLPAYRTLFNSLGGLTLTQDALNAAIATSIGGGKDLSQVSSALAKAYTGQTTALSKLNVGFTKAELSSMSFDEILAKLQSKFSGAAATNAETFATKMDRIRLATKQATDAIGEGFIYAIEESGRKSGRTIDDVTAKIVFLGERTSQYIRLIASTWTTTSDTIENSWFGKLLSVANPNNTILSRIFNLPMEGLKAFNEEASKLQDPFGNYNPSTRADRKSANAIAEAMAKQEQRRIYLAEQARKRAAAAELARQRASKAEEKKRQQLEAEINKIQKNFDIERIGLELALGREQDENVKNRLQKLIQLNEMQYAELDSMTQMQDKLKELTALQDAYTASVVKSAQAWQGIVTSPNAGAFRLAEQQANQGLGAGSFAAPTAAQFRQAEAAMGGINIPITIQGSVVAQQDLTQAVLDAVNTATRGGGNLRGLPQAI